MPIPADIRRKVTRLRREIVEHDRRYYILSEPTISDEEYDQLFRELKRIEAEYPELITADSPTQRVGGSIARGFSDVSHRTPMLSIASLFAREEISEFDAKLRRALSQDSIEYVCELKFDGLAINLTYEGGALVTAALRGNGYSGEDVLKNALHVKSIPKKFIGAETTRVVEVRGEIVMPRSAFQSLRAHSSKGSVRSKWVNPRNAASGQMRQLEPDIEVLSELLFCAYGVGYFDSDEFPVTQMALLDWLASRGMKISPRRRLVQGADGVIEFHKELSVERDKLDFDIDGVVAKVNNLEFQRRLGVAARDVKWAAAYKFKAEKKATRILRIDVQIGRTGVVTPVARLEPVFVGQALVSNATLHNESEIARKQIFVNDVVWVRRAGDVIPEVIEVAEPGPRRDVDRFVMPIKCPLCNSIIERVEDQKAYRCTGTFVCPAQIKESVIHFASRNAMNIENVGDSFVEVLVNEFGLRSVADLYDIPRLVSEWLETLEPQTPLRDLATLSMPKSPLWQRLFETSAMPLFIGEIDVDTALRVLAQRGQSDTDVVVLLLSLLPKSPPTGEEGRRRTRLGETDAYRLLQQINLSKRPSLSRFLYAMGIRLIGEEIAKKFAVTFVSWENLKAQNWTQLVLAKQQLQKENAARKRRGEVVVEDKIAGLGAEMLASVGEFFNSAECNSVVDRLFALGVEVQPVESHADEKTGPLAGKSFLFTGTLSTMSRTKAEGKVIELGATVLSAVSKKLGYLVVGEKPGSKLKDAEKLGVPALTEADFLRLLDEVTHHAQ